MMAANKRLCEREPDLPGLPLLLDPDRLGRQLGLGPLSLEYLRLKSGNSCTASYRAGNEWLVAKAVTPSRLDELGNSGRAQNKLIIWHGIAVKISPPTADRRMPGLSKALDERNSRVFLEEMREKADIYCNSLQILKLKPQRRLVARLENDGAPCAFLKIHAAAYHSPALIAATAAQQLGGPKLLYADSHAGIILTEWLAGKTASSATASLDEAAAAGRMIALTHQQSIRLPMRLERKAEIMAMNAVLQDCAQLLPQLRTHLADLGPRLRDILLSHPSEYGLIHGDYALDQILHRKGKARIIDWDRASMGDQANDTGCFLARLSKDVLDGRLEAARAEEIEAAFLAAYREIRALPPATHAQRLRHLVLLMIEDFRNQQEDWDQKIASLLDHIHQLSREGVKGPLTYPDPDMPDLANILYADGILRLLGDRQIKLTGPAQLFRHKAGRRALAEYPAEPAPLIAKMSHKRLKSGILHLHQDLRKAGFDGSGADGLEVPEILGTDNRLGLMLMHKLPGAMLMSDSLDGADTLMRAGRALAHVHLSAVSTRRCWTMEDEATVLSDALAKASSLRPAHARELSRISARATKALTQLSPVKPVLIHRDFYQDQVLVTPDKISLLDFDLAAMGDPAVDLGNFIAHLRELSLRRHGDTASLAALEQAFLAGYVQMNPKPDPDRIELLAQTSLARHLFISLRIEQRRPIFERLLQECRNLSQSW